MSLSNYIEKPQTELFNELGIIFAFSEKQYDEQKIEGLTYVQVASGVLCPEENVKDFYTKHSQIITNGIAADLKENGKIAIIERELENYECRYVGDYNQCVEALEKYDITEEEIKQVWRS